MKNRTIYTIATLKTVKEQVEDILTKVPESRANDKLLQVQVLKRFYGVILIDDILNHDVPSLETIRRTRAALQSGGNYLPGEEVKEARAAHAIAYKSFVRGAR